MREGSNRGGQEARACRVGNWGIAYGIGCLAETEPGGILSGRIVCAAQLVSAHNAGVVPPGKVPSPLKHATVRMLLLLHAWLSVLACHELSRQPSSAVLKAVLC